MSPNQGDILLATGGCSWRWQTSKWHWVWLHLPPCLSAKKETTKESNSERCHQRQLWRHHPEGGKGGAAEPGSGTGAALTHLPPFPPSLPTLGDASGAGEGSREGAFPSPAADEQEQQGPGGPGGTTSLLSEGSGKTQPRPARSAGDARLAEGEAEMRRRTHLIHKNKNKIYTLKADAASNTSPCPGLPPRPKFPHCERPRGGPPAPPLTSHHRPRPLGRRPPARAPPWARCLLGRVVPDRRGQRLHFPAGTAPGWVQRGCPSQGSCVGSLRFKPK